ncbi:MULTISPECIES: helix-turn-helix domain-containing protein [Aeromicrobium]|jgi:transcriptional regulator with XRE-family HTH domain|uniref:XRE family transcriptional regulator n=2 Tax=Aeromicrobium TaxID=2040 RepID=A0A0U4D5R5_9ACTN|nr:MULTISPECIES: XRE family transcriptional regulator [Aeromicrobium]ALX03554.1 XRE family transcriptional regulator [Aeromicrobium erythreum]MCO7238853.1 XRE family transcriptional regulator [Aeromicrobium sp. CnD17-E]MCX6406357.1 XRE family transcriptional regulator [Propionibacteriales bacterium]MDR6118276.1 transcriptional regulator with XRE-family HTH domain [Aeromicrobium sp. SORGH_AS_0981]
MTDDAPLLRNAAGSARDRDPAEPVEAMALEQAIAVNVRHHRTAAGLSVADMAQRLGLSKAMLSKIENAQTSCSLATLQRLATGLDVPVTSLVRGADEERQAVFTPAGQGPRIARHGTKEGHEYELLGALRGQHKRLESLMVTLTEDSQTYPLFQHPGTEFLHVLEGRMVYGHGRETYELGPGDSLQLDGEGAHGPVELKELPIRFLSVIAFPDASV